MSTLWYKKKIIWKTHYLYNSYWITKFLNKIMFSGKKQTAINNVFYIFNKLKKFKNNSKSPNFLFLNLIVKFKPRILLAPFRKGRLIHFVPIPISYMRAFKTILKWLVLLAKQQQIYNKRLKNIKIKEHYSNVFINIFSKNNKNLLINKISTDIEIIEQNKIYVHYRWKN